jgi:hypothetical protein
MGQSQGGNASASAAAGSTTAESAGSAVESISTADATGASLHDSVSASVANIDSVTSTALETAAGEGGESGYGPVPGKSLRPGVTLMPGKDTLKASQISGINASGKAGSGNSASAKSAIANVLKAGSASSIGLGMRGKASFGGASSTGIALAGVNKPGANPGGVQTQKSGVKGGASYSQDFPDSTMGTALLSPPDLGTESPFDWTTDLDYEFADMEQAEFLSPTLHVSPMKKGSLQGKKQLREMLRRRRKSQQGTSGTFSDNLKSVFMPQDTLGQDTLQTDISEPGIEPDILNQPGLHTSLNDQH